MLLLGFEISNESCEIFSSVHVQFWDGYLRAASVNFIVFNYTNLIFFFDFLTPPMPSIFEFLNSLIKSGHGLFLKMHSCVFSSKGQTVGIISHEILRVTRLRGFD